MNPVTPGKILSRALQARVTPLPRLQPSFSARLFSIHAPTSAPIRPSLKFRKPQLRCDRQARRHASTEISLGKTWRENPVMFPLSILAVLSGLSTAAYTVYYYRVHIIDDFKAFPEPVAKHLRRALYYSNISLDPKKALHNYQQAILVAEDLNLDPFSNEVLGIKFQVAAFFEKIGLYHKAIDVLEQVRADCLKWNEVYGEKEENAEKRTRLLGKAVQLSTKLGEYYSQPSINDQEAAEAKLVWAVTTMLKEQQRRTAAGIKPDDLGGWISQDETGAALEALADHYAAASLHHLSAPLYLQAMSLAPPKSCHTVVLMNNLAIALALQHPPATPTQPAASAADQISSARTWAKKALALAASIGPPERNEECDQGCAVATVNLGDFAEMEGDMEEARRRWEEGRSLSRAIGFAEGETEVMRKLNRLAVGKTPEEIEKAKKIF